MSEGRLDRKEIAKRVYFAELASQEQELKGEERFQFIIKEARISPHTEERRIQELINYGRRLIHGKSAMPPVERIDPKPAGSLRVKYILKLESEMTPEEHKELEQARTARKSK